MSLLTTPTTTSTTWSYQLQFNFKFRKPQTPLLFAKARFSSIDDRRRHNLRVHCVAQDEVKNGSESEQRISGDSWTNSNSDTSSVNDVLSDWFGNSDQSSNSGKKNGIGGERINFLCFSDYGFNWVFNLGFKGIFFFMNYVLVYWLFWFFKLGQERIVVLELIKLVKMCDFEYAIT